MALNGKTAQDKTDVNVSPLFDLFDKDGISYGDKTVYEATNFLGNKIFSYKQGSGVNDTELGFPFHRNITQQRRYFI